MDTNTKTYWTNFIQHDLAGFTVALQGLVGRTDAAALMGEIYGVLKDRVPAEVFTTAAAIVGKDFTTGIRQ